MLLLDILLVFLVLVCIALAGVVLLQRSEGGALGMGGGPSGFLSTRGAGDLLTRITWILGGGLFFLCLGLTVLQGRLHHGGSVVDRLKIDPLAADQQPAPRPLPAPAGAAPGAAGAPATGFDAPAPQVHAGAAPGAATGAVPAAAVAQTPPDTGSGPVDPFANTVGGLPAQGTTPAPRKR